jgi:hydrogenase nickel incorporation protein HypA/HybF
MHEVALAREIINIAQKTAESSGLIEISKVEIEVGELLGVQTEALDFALKSIIGTSPFKKTSFEFVPVKGKAVCSDCGQEFETSTFYEMCPKCQNYHIQVTGGNGLRVKFIEGK